MSLSVFVIGKRYIHPVPASDSPLALARAVIAECDLPIQPDELVLRKVGGNITPGAAEALFESAGEEGEIIDGRPLPTGGDNIVAKVVPAACCVFALSRSIICF